jgi:calcium-dependent protein kinase
MPRIDAADLHRLREYKAPVSCGFPGGFHEKYEAGQELGRGGFGVVRVAREKATGKEYAVKSIRKVSMISPTLDYSPPGHSEGRGCSAALPARQVLDIPNLSIERQAAYLANIKREAAVLHRLRGTLNAVQIMEVMPAAVKIKLCLSRRIQ